MTAFHSALPSWWIRLYEGSLQASPALKEQEIPFSLYPSLNPDELVILANIFSGCQARLQSGEKEIRVAANLGERLQSSARSAQCARGRELPLILAQLKIIAKSLGQRAQLLPSFIFQDERWEQNAKGQIEALSYGQTVNTLELLLGYLDPYMEHVRQAEGVPALAKVIDHPPLLLWSSAWLDLSGHELLVYLRMQRASQWQLNCLSLDGVYQASIAELLADVPWQNHKRALKLPNLDRALLFTGRILHRLAEHGAIHPVPSLEVFPFGEFNPRGGMNLAWKVADINRQEKEAFQSACSAATLFTERFVDELLPARRLPLLRDARSADRIVADLQALGDSMEAAEVSGFLSHQGDARIFAHLPLFSEWTCRFQHADQRSLPDSLKASILGPILDPLSPQAAAERFRRFVQVVKDQPYYNDLLFKEEGGSISGLHKAMKAPLRSSFEALASPASSPSSVPAHAPSLAASQAEAPLPLQSAAKPNQGMPQAALGRLQKIASDELSKLSRFSPARYRRLTQRFISTLDDHSQRILQELQGRISPDMFEQHIQKRLINYMIENPSDWHRMESAAN